MQNSLKYAVVAVLAAGSAMTSIGAYAAPLGPVDQGSSSLVLFVQDVQSNGTVRASYGLNTGLSLDSLLPTGSLVSNANLNTSISAGTHVFGPSTALTNFINTANGNAGDTLLWSVEGGQYNDIGFDPITSDVTTPGDAKSVFSSVLSTTNGTLVSSLIATSFVNLLQQYHSLTGSVNALAGALGSNSEISQSGGALWSAVDQQKGGLFGNGVTPDVNTAGSPALSLFGITGNDSGGKVQSYVLGTATFAADGTLTIASAGAPSVPVPAAIWLLGSGLMGFFGVARRRLAVAA